MGMFVHDNPSEISDSNGFIYTLLTTKEDIENYEKRSVWNYKRWRIL